jgi:chemotaxis protein CheD
MPTSPAPAGRGYFDQRFNATIINVAPGAQAVSSTAGEVLSTVLGSCVAACLRDPLAGVGGMNHFLLPGDGDGPEPAADDLRFGVASMEQLINALLKRGAARGRLEAKLFGGAALMASCVTGSVGARNAAFALRFLHREGIPVAAQDLGGPHPRRANYEPTTGRAWVNRLDAPRASGIIASETAYRQSIMRRDPALDLEVF